jgi:hypothetical protein
LLLLILTGLCWREGEAAEPATAVEECLRGAEIRACVLRFSLAAFRQANGQCCSLALDRPRYYETKDNLWIRIFFYLNPRNSKQKFGSEAAVARVSESILIRYDCKTKDDCIVRASVADR